MDPVRILLVRHGESEGNVAPEFYLTKGDSKVGLTEKGWWQVDRTGKFLGVYCPEVGMTEWPMVHVSPHQRTLESLSGILHGMGSLFPGQPKIYPQPFLVEKFFGAASALAFPDGKVSQEILDAISHLSAKVYGNDPFTAKHLFGESTKDTMLAAKLLMEGTIRRDIEEGKKNILIVCHGAVIQAILMNWMHVLPRDKNKIGNPDNGDVIEIHGVPKNWKFTRIWDGKNGQRVSQDLGSRIKRFTVDDLPTVPEFLKQAP